MDAFLNLCNQLQLLLFEGVVQPLMFHLGLASLLEDGFRACTWFLLGVLQIIFIATVLAFLERIKPVEAITDKKAVRTDILYTCIHRLGLFRLVLFFSINPILDSLLSSLRVQGFTTLHIDALLGVQDYMVLSFILYLIVFDFADYWLHRAQHHFNWWWQLHALHHSQRQMTKWTDNRNHLLDDLLRDIIMVLIAWGIGIAPEQFMLVTAFTQLSESLQHANARIWFGTFGERLWISPRFHRLHHAIGIGHEQKGKKHTLGGCNFGVLLPWWDMLFSTADFTLRFDKTGIRDQVEADARGKVRDYGRGFWQQQILGILRLVAIKRQY